MRGIWEFDLLANGAGIRQAPTVEVTVRRESDYALASLSEDVDGAFPLANPFSAVNGRVLFYAPYNARYRIDIAEPFARIFRHQSVSSPFTLQHGTATFNSTTGVSVPLSPNALTTDYHVSIMPLSASGYIGEVHIENRAVDGFDVFNSGSDTTTTFSWAISE